METITKTQLELRTELLALNERLGHVQTHYRLVKAECDILDKELCSLYRRKFAIETRLTPIKIVPTRKPTVGKKPPLTEVIALMKSMSPEQLRNTLQLMGMDQFGSVDISDVDDNFDDLNNIEEIDDVN